uniref:Uncharacterized protein n=1 Tax=Phytophthora ramorum TaxID=164328 RepID=H3HAW6_PHYRM
MATFSRPTPQTPSPEAVARLYFHLSADHQRVRGFTVEQDPHFHDLEAFKFNEAVLDRVVRRKLQLQSARLVDLSDEFASTRVPAVMRAREEEQRDHEREATEEYLLEQMQHSDSYNDGKLPVELFRETVDALELSSSMVPREVLLALVSADRDDMMAATLRGGEEDEALDAFEVVSARQTHYTVEKLIMLLEAHAERVAEAANAVAARRAAAELELQQEATTAIPEETNESENEDQEDKEDKVTPDTVPTSDEATNSATEVDEEVLCEKLGALLRRVRRMIFRFQRKAFIDRPEKYLLQQFQAFEKCNLQGSSKHLKQRLTQKEVKAAMKSMQKLLLSPYQLMQLVAIVEERTNAPEHVVYYHEFIPRLTQHLGELINVNTLAEKSALLHDMGVWDFATEGLPSEDV